MVLGIMLNLIRPQRARRNSTVKLVAQNSDTFENKKWTKKISRPKDPKKKCFGGKGNIIKMKNGTLH